MPPFAQPPAVALAGKGTTRAIDLCLNKDDLSTVSTMIWKSGVLVTGRVVSSGASWVFQNGRQALAISSGIGNGWFSQMGLVPTIVRPQSAGALANKSGLSRLLVNFACGDLTGVTNANSDIGVDMLIGVPSGISDLRTNNNTHLPGAAGVGVVLALDGTWRFINKKADTPAGTFAEYFILPAACQTALNSGTPVEIEFRVYDATFALEAKLELYINGSKILTRYWTNPTGVVDVTLPPMGIAAAGVTGTVLILQLRNTSTGPPANYFYDPTLIQGPNDSGTL